MMYEPMAVREYRSGQEMKAAYNSIRIKRFERAKKAIAERCEKDKEVITALRDFTRRQFTIIGQLVSQAQDFQAKIDALRQSLAGSQEELDRLMARRKAAQVAIEVDETTLTFVRVLAAVAQVYQLAPAVIKGPSRYKRVVAARSHLVGILTANRPDLSLRQIGTMLGRDYSTVLHARTTWARNGHERRFETVAINNLLGLGQTVDSAHKVAEDQIFAPCDDKIAACG